MPQFTSKAITKNKLTTHTLVSLILCFLLSCGGGSNSDSPQSDPYVYQMPSDLNDGWQVDHASNQGVDDNLLADMVNNIQDEVDQFRYIDSVLIAKNGKLLLNEQFKTALDFTDGWANNQNIDLHIMNSVSKSFVSTMVGIAIDQQFIPGVDALVHDYFQHKLPVANWTSEKENITLKNWLTMRHGYQWNEWNVSYFDPTNQNAQMNNSPDPINFLLGQPMATTPGETFAYSTGVSFALGRLVENATGQSLVNFMQTNFFDPLSINQYTYWSLDGTPHMGSALYFTTRDMAKLGQLYLDKGMWNGQRILSESWIEEATQAHHQAITWGYGYQWWITTFRSNGVTYSTYYADGLGGQYIFVFPELNAVVAFTGDAYEQEERDQRSNSMILQDYIIPALVSP